MSRYSVKVSKESIEDDIRLVTIRWPIELEMGDALERLVSAGPGTICNQSVGRMTGERTEHMVVAFPDDRADFAFILARHADQTLALAERRAHLRLYCFETILGPPVYLALNPSRRTDEAFAILAGEGVTGEDDPITEADLAVVPRERAQRLTIRGENQTLWEAFCDKVEPCVVASGDPED
jgi:hypothetical protein